MPDGAPWRRGRAGAIDPADPLLLGRMDPVQVLAEGDLHAIFTRPRLVFVRALRARGHPPGAAGTPARLQPTGGMLLNIAVDSAVPYRAG